MPIGDTAPPGTALLLVDDDGVRVGLDRGEAETLLAITGGLETATVSACPRCRSRVLAAVAFVDLLSDAPPHPRTEELITLAEEAPTLHVYVADLLTRCVHRAWRDPLFEEWADVLEAPARAFRRR